mgnify:CR=1 FL=1
MKKLLTIMCAVVMVVGLAAGQAFAIGYEVDINPTSTPGTDFDTTATVDVLSSYTIDIHLTGAPQAMITSGVSGVY